MINFYPGPSKIYPQVKDYIIEGVDSGILSMNHRSPEFMSLIEDTIRLLRIKLNVPKDYQVIFTSSATECWEIIAQSLIKDKSCHVYSGAFGEKWMNYTAKLGKQVQSGAFQINDLPKVDLGAQVDTICLTQNETSNGTQVPYSTFRDVRRQYPDQLITVDATSSMAGISLDFSVADVWFASVQKCFGLPAGMALLICGSKAIQRAQELNENNHYNSLTFLLENAIKNQTAYTPNILGIFLLNRLLKDFSDIDKVHSRTMECFYEVLRWVKESRSLSLYVQNEEVISNTVFALVSKDYSGTEIRRMAEKENIIIGSGYGLLKQSTFRIANFPAIEKKEWAQLETFLTRL